MIWESHYWKEDVLRRARDLDDRKTQRRWLDSSFARLEQNLMIGFYSLRKLIEANTLSDATIHKRVPIVTYPAKGKPIHLLNWHRIDRLYDLENGNPATIGLLPLCHQFVHSYVFVPELREDGGLGGVFIVSGKRRHESIYFIDVNTIINLFELVGNDYPSQGSYKLKPHKGDYKVSNQ